VDADFREWLVGIEERAQFAFSCNQEVSNA
jgi:hypothetical protein